MNSAAPGSRLARLQAHAHRTFDAVPALCYVWNERTDGPVIRQHVPPGASTQQRYALMDSAEAFKRKHGHLNGWSPNTKTAQEIFRAAFGREQTSKRQTRDELAAAGHKSKFPSAEVVRHVLTTAHDWAFDDKRPSGRDILRANHDPETAAVYAKRKSKHAKRVMSELEQHPTGRRLGKQGLRSSRDVSAINGATLAGGVAELYKRADIAKRLDRQDDALVELRLRVAELESRAIATEKRHDVSESGQHWHDIAKRMRSEGKSYGDIATATGQNRSAVSKYILRTQK